MHRAGQELLAAVGLPPDLRTPRRPSRPSAETVAISFYDVYRYLYLDQNSIDRNVVGHDDDNLNIKRVAVFELLYGLTDPHILELAAERGRYSNEADRMRSAAQSVAEFLQANAELNPASLGIERARLELLCQQTEQALADLRMRVNRLSPMGTRATRIAALRAQLAELETERQALQRDVDKDRSVLAQLELDEQAAYREDVASESLSGLEFTRCPRCLQSIRDKEEQAGHCILCGLPDPAEPGSLSVELSRIRDQRNETQQLLAEDIAGLERASVEADHVRNELGREIEISVSRTYTLEDPLLDEVAEAARAAALASAQLENVIGAQARWASYSRLISQAEEAEATSRSLADKEAQLRIQLAESSSRIDEFSQLFDEILAGLRDPWYHEAHIDKDSYLPVVDGEQFDMLSVSGARKTLVNLAYHLANLGMSLSHAAEVKLPRLLIIDSPRKNVGAGAWDRSVVQAVYKRLEAFNSARHLPGGQEFQIIIADNELPREAKRWIPREIALSYDRPFVPGVSHPREGVESIGGASTRELS